MTQPSSQHRQPQLQLEPITPLNCSSRLKADEAGGHSIHPGMRSLTQDNSRKEGAGSSNDIETCLHRQLGGLDVS